MPTLIEHEHDSMQFNKTGKFRHGTLSLDVVECCTHVCFMEAALQPLAEKEIYERPELPLGGGISDGIRDDRRGIDAADSSCASFHSCWE